MMVTSKKTAIITLVAILMIALGALTMASWMTINAGYADIRCRACHREFNRLLNTEAMDILSHMDSTPAIPFGSTIEGATTFFSTWHPWMCTLCLNSISYAAANNFPFSHPAWKGFFE